MPHLHWLRLSDDTIILSLLWWRALWCVVYWIAASLRLIRILWGLHLDTALLSVVSLVAVESVASILLIDRRTVWGCCAAIIRLIGVVIVGVLRSIMSRRCVAGEPASTISRSQTGTAAATAVDT